MRLYEIAQEISPGWLKEKILVECSQIVSLYKSEERLFFRGSSNKHSIAYKSESRRDRRPTDTEKPVQKKVDSLLRASGFQAYRRNSIFVTSDYLTAKMYSVGHTGVGDIYVIFPINGFKFTWSPVIRDFHASVGKLPFQRWARDANSTPNQLKKFKETFKYQNTDLDGALNSANEVLINGAYYAISYERASKYIREIVRFRI